MTGHVKRATILVLAAVALLAAVLLIGRQSGQEPSRDPEPSAESRGPVRRADLPQNKPDVFIYLIDALRADHVGCYGYGRPTTPNIDAFAQEAVLFEHAQAPSSSTLPRRAPCLSCALVLHTGSHSQGL
jgi:glucan phosphoethanolaminetransferase (alkaline phosphatase superfamily)